MLLVVAQRWYIKRADDLSDADNADNDNDNADNADFWSQVFVKCSGMSLRKTAKDNEQDFSAEVVDAVFKDFYMDDLLKSFADAEHAVNLVDNYKNCLLEEAPNSQNGFQTAVTSCQRFQWKNELHTSRSRFEIRQLAFG